MNASDASVLRALTFIKENSTGRSLPVIKSDEPDWSTYQDLFYASLIDGSDKNTNFLVNLRLTQKGEVRLAHLIDRKRFFLFRLSAWKSGAKYVASRLWMLALVAVPSLVSWLLDLVASN